MSLFFVDPAADVTDPERVCKLCLGLTNDAEPDNSREVVDANLWATEGLFWSTAARRRVARTVTKVKKPHPEMGEVLELL